MAIQKIRQTDGDAIAKAAKEREDKILEMESNKDSLKARISTTTNHVTNLEHTIESIRSEFKAQESKIKGKRAEQAQINREIKAMKSSGTDRYVSQLVENFETNILGEVTSGCVLRLI